MGKKHYFLFLSNHRDRETSPSLLMWNNMVAFGYFLYLMVGSLSLLNMSVSDLNHEERKRQLLLYISRSRFSHGCSGWQLASSRSWNILLISESFILLTKLVWQEMHQCSLVETKVKVTYFSKWLLHVVVLIFFDVHIGFERFRTLCFYAKK